MLCYQTSSFKMSEHEMHDISHTLGLQTTPLNATPNFGSLRSSLDQDSFLSQPCDVIILDNVPEALEGTVLPGGGVLQGRSKHRVSDFASHLTPNAAEQTRDAEIGPRREAARFRERLMVRSNC